MTSVSAPLARSLTSNQSSLGRFLIARDHLSNGDYSRSGTSTTSGADRV